MAKNRGFPYDRRSLIESSDLYHITGLIYTTGIQCLKKLLSFQYISEYA